MPSVEAATSLVAIARNERPSLTLSARWVSSRMSMATIQTT